MLSARVDTADVAGTLPVTERFKSNSGIAANSDPVRERIETLDLDPIKIKLMDPEEGEGWSRSQADEVDLMYRRFLFLIAKYPSRSLVPNNTVDIFWHAHILDTRKYAEDCEHIFGHFLHHFPYFGMRGVQDARDLEGAFAESNRLYVAEFGQQATMVMADGVSLRADNAKCKKDDPPPPPPTCDWDWPDPDIRATRTRPSLRERTPRVCLYST